MGEVFICIATVGASDQIAGFASDIASQPLGTRNGCDVLQSGKVLHRGPLSQHGTISAIAASLTPVLSGNLGSETILRFMTLFCRMAVTNFVDARQ